MSLEDNKVLVRDFVEAINERDWRRLDRLVAPGSSDTARPPRPSGAGTS